MSLFEQTLWVEKYRPRTIKDCILPESLTKTFQAFVDAKEFPNLLLCGPAGIGKTSVAKALCDEAGYDYLFLNASDNEVAGIAAFRTKIKGYASSASLDGKKKVIIFDEADYLSAATQVALRGAIEEFADNCSFIFTCNFKDKIIAPIHSRCAVIDFRLKKSDQKVIAEEFSEKIGTILADENVEYKPLVVVKIMMKYFPDFRRTLNELQKLARQFDNNIGEEALEEIVSDVSFLQLIEHLKAKDVIAIRKWVAKNSDRDPVRIYRQLYDILEEKLEVGSIPDVILVLAEYGFRNGQVADLEINTTACLVELMFKTKWKE